MRTHAPGHRRALRVRRSLLFFGIPFLSILTACADDAALTSPEATSLTPQYASASDHIPGEFIVTLRGGVDAATVAREHAVSPRHVYTAVINGFAGPMAEAARSGLLRDARVLRVEQDARVSVDAVQPAASWGLDRVDQRSRPLDGYYNHDFTGAGVTVYVIDTGIWFTHQEFNDGTGSRATPAYDVFNGDPYGYGVDCHGHGTHVSGTVGGNTFGIAKGVQLKAVRVLDCAGSGSWSGVLAGMDWVVSNAVKPAVVNMSLGGAASATIDDAVARLTAASITVVVAAGNNNVDACTSSPARAPSALTIGATDALDVRASFSNYGSCVDWFAPGVNIVSAVKGADDRTATWSGTSMAAPHVTGTAALLLEAQPTATVQTVQETLYSWTTKGIVGNALTPANHLSYSLGTVQEVITTPPPTEPPPPPPPPAISLQANGRKVKSARYVDLTWEGAVSTQVDVYRNGSRLRTVTNSGSWTDAINVKGSTTLTYRVCEAGSSTCSSDVTLQF